MYEEQTNNLLNITITNSLLGVFTVFYIPSLLSNFA